MSDILSSFSLLFAALALFYSTWYKKIMDLIDNWSPPGKQREREHLRYLSNAKQIKRFRLLPLLIGSLLITLLLFYEMFKIILEIFEYISQYGFNSIIYFDTFKAVIVLLSIFSFALFNHLRNLYSKLDKKIKSK